MQEGDCLTLEQYAIFQHLAKLIRQRAVMNTPFRDFHVHQAALATLLSEHNYCESTDPRNMIYALLNLANIDQLGITPRYGKIVPTSVNEWRGRVHFNQSLNLASRATILRQS